MSARDVGHLLASGVWTHDRPLRAAELQELGLPVEIGVDRRTAGS
jgi:Serine dehydrogenase proteinase